MHIIDAVMKLALVEQRNNYMNFTERIFGFDGCRGDERFALSFRVDGHHTEVVLLTLVEVLGGRRRIVRPDVARTLGPLVGAFRLLLQHVVVDRQPTVVFRRLPLQRYGTRSRLCRLQRSLWR